MSHAIFVRRPSHYFDPLPKPLATDLATESAARQLARRLASSYRCHGCHEATGVFWFRDEQGLAEIWAQPQEPCTNDEARRGGCRAGLSA